MATENHGSASTFGCNKLFCLLLLSQVVFFGFLYNYVSNSCRCCNQSEVTEKLPSQNRDKRETTSSELKQKPNESPAKIYVNDGGADTHDTAESNTTATWVWINPYSRVPMRSVQEICVKAHEFCKPIKGEPGMPGIQGEKGKPGMKGDPGHPGVSGLAGPRGERGEKGEPGWPGLDGAPGEPGLDGKPGKHGRDGVPGVNGKPGERGLQGIPGSNGKPGADGAPGLQGPIGPKGERGPRGKGGQDGTPGKPGIPGIQAYNLTAHGNTSILTPPVMIRPEPPIRRIIVQERQFIRLQCPAIGSPTPTIIWQKVENGNLVPLGINIENDIILEHVAIKFPNISRVNSGEYNCIADNGIPPRANITFEIDVHFPPMIEVKKPVVKAAIGGEVTLECLVEANPTAVCYWQTKNEKSIPSDSKKYRTNFTENGSYKITMELSILEINSTDINQYICVAKNREGVTKGYVNLTLESDTQAEQVIYGPTIEQSSQIYGPKAPEPAGTLCKECEKCKICGFGYKDLQISKFVVNNSKELPKRIKNCELETIGKPVYHNSIANMTYGAWMRDSCSQSNEYVWATYQNSSTLLYEFASKQQFTNGESSVVHSLEIPFQGSGHVICNGSFYYNEQNKTVIRRYDLKTKKTSIPKELPDASNNKLYKVHRQYVDLNIDANGLWAIYGLHDNTAVVMLNNQTLEIEYGWNISVKHQDVGEMFIACGVLYAIDSVSDFKTKISLALDLYEEKLLDDENIAFTNPFKNTTSVSYNYQSNELLTWDGGNMLSYPVKFNDNVSSNETSDAAEQKDSDDTEYIA